MRITGVELNMAEDVFKLAHLLGANLLANREEACQLPSSHTSIAAQALYHLIAIQKLWPAAEHHQPAGVTFQCLYARLECTALMMLARRRLRSWPRPQ